MEKIKEFYDNLRDRFSNPLFFSFVCGWIVFNWEVIIALLWYAPEKIPFTGNNNIFDFISARRTPVNTVWGPLAIAIGYTFGMPIIKNVIRAFYSWASKWGTDWNLNISKGGKIPIEKYFSFRKDYEKRTQILQDVIEKEDTLTVDYETLKTTYLETSSLLSEANKKFADAMGVLMRFSDVRVLNGKWINLFTDKIDSILNGREEIEIENGKYYVINTVGDRTHEFNLIEFHFDSRTGDVFFIKERINTTAPYERVGDGIHVRYNPNQLKFESNDVLKGTENGSTRITYIKQTVESLFSNERPSSTHENENADAPNINDNPTNTALQKS